MGQVLSVVTSGIEAVLQGVTKMVSDGQATVQQLQNISSGLSQQTNALMRAELQRLSAGARLPRLTHGLAFAAGNTVDSTLAATIKAAATASSTLFNTQYAGVTGNTDSGVVNSFDPNSNNIQPIVDQITNDFTNWGLPTSGTTPTMMAKTIQEQVKAQMGLAGSSYGVLSLNLNQQIDWTVSYGMFQVTQSTNGLVYGFTAALAGGWG